MCQADAIAAYDKKDRHPQVAFIAKIAVPGVIELQGRVNMEKRDICCRYKA